VGGEPTFALTLISHLVGHDQMVLGVDGDLYIVADGPLPLEQVSFSRAQAARLRFRHRSGLRFPTEARALPKSAPLARLLQLAAEISSLGGGNRSSCPTVSTVVIFKLFRSDIRQ